MTKSQKEKAEKLIEALKRVRQQLFDAQLEMANLGPELAKLGAENVLIEYSHLLGSMQQGVAATRERLSLRIDCTTLGIGPEPVDAGDFLEVGHG